MIIFYILLFSALAAMMFVLELSHAADDTWRGAASELLLSFVREGLRARRTIVGKRDGVTIEISQSGGKNAATCFKVTPQALAPSLTVRAEGAWTNLGKILTGEDVLLRDPDFDRDVNIHGHEDEVVALMDHRTRRGVMELVGLGGSIEDGTITLRRPGVARDRAELVRLTSLLLDLGKRLNHRPFPVRLLENAQSDPLFDVRVRNLEVLAKRYGFLAEAKTATARALEDKSPRVRVAGALLDKGEAGLTVLQSLVQDAGVPADVRAASLEHLVTIFSYENAKAAVSAALEASDVGLKRAAVAAVSRAKDADRALEIAALASETDAALCEAVATTLGQLGDARAEGALIKLLDREEPAVRLAAAKALGLVGTVHAVEPLLPLTRGLLGDDKVREAAQDAVRRIQLRLGDAEAGRVSIAKVEDVAGAVSVAADGGELSLPPEKKRES